MANLVAATNWGAALYLLAWILIGHFVVLTLFLAVILEAFESMYDVKTGKDLIIAEIEAHKRVAPPGSHSDQQTSTLSVDESSEYSAFVAEFSRFQRSGVRSSFTIAQRHQLLCHCYCTRYIRCYARSCKLMRASVTAIEAAGPVMC